MKIQWFSKLVFVLIVVPLLGCRSSDESPEAKVKGPVEVRVASARVDTLQAWQELPASVEPTRVAALASPAEGPVTRLRVREADEVSAGAILVTVGRSAASSAALEAARGERERVEQDFARIEQLVDRGVLPGEDLDLARVGLERAKATEEAGEQDLEDFAIRAPWAGVVSRVLVQEGNYVAPRTPLVEIFDPASLVLRFSLPEAAALTVTVGTAARVRFDAYPGVEADGEVTRIYPELDRQLRTRTVEVEVSDDVALIPGLFARVRLPVRVASDAVVVPASAVSSTLDQGRVVFVVEDGVVRLRAVEVGVEEGASVEITSGLEPGEAVAVSGLAKLRDGVAVRTAAERPGAGGTDKAKSPGTEAP